MVGSDVAKHSITALFFLQLERISQQFTEPTFSRAMLRWLSFSRGQGSGIKCHFRKMRGLPSPESHRGTSWLSASDAARIFLAEQFNGDAEPEMNVALIMRRCLASPRFDGDASAILKCAMAESHSAFRSPLFAFAKALRPSAKMCARHAGPTLRLHHLPRALVSLRAARISMAFSGRPK